MRKLALALASTALVVSVPADAHQFGPGYWSAGGYWYVCLLPDGTATANTAGRWKGVWSKQTYDGMETGTVVGNSEHGKYNDSMVIKRGTFVWNEWTDDLSYAGFLGNLQWLWLGHRCKG